MIIILVVIFKSLVGFVAREGSVLIVDVIFVVVVVERMDQRCVFIEVEPDVFERFMRSGSIPTAKW